MRSMLVGAVVLFAVALLPATSTAGDSPLICHLGVGYAKWLEDGAPDGGVGFGGGVIYKLADKPFGIGGNVEYLMLGSTEESGTSGGVPVTVEGSVASIPITGQLYYLAPAGETSTIYAGLGFGVYMMRAKITVKAQGQEQETSTDDSEIGMNFGGGMIFGGSEASVKFGFDVKYHLVFADESTGIISAGGKIYF